MTSRSIAASGLLAEVQQKAEPLLQKLDPVSRAKVLMTLLGLVLVGLALMALAWLGGRHYLRIARKPLGPTVDHQDDWYRKPLVSPEGDAPPSGDGQ